MIDLENLENPWVEELARTHPEFFQKARTRLVFPLVATDDLLGLMTVGDRVRGKPFSIEELDLIKTIADQVAGSLLNLKLSESLRKAKEMEAFQTVASFFVHDLKNLASSLSLMLQNMPAHFDNPEFREDALGVLSLNVTKINSLCTRISSLRERLQIQPTETDLNELVRITLKEFDDAVTASIAEELHPVPRVLLDPEQIQKVLTNLVLNANEALEGKGEIRVITGKRDGWVEFTVSDSGCGISREFVENVLFRPFKTTKKQGMGIGLFHSKMIVEAHKGRIEVESEEGVGSTFRVLLPMRES
jgi:putative PEP-CTERM system histidine kinase